MDITVDAQRTGVQTLMRYGALMRKILRAMAH
jgi:hypothetical protein